MKKKLLLNKIRSISLFGTLPPIKGISGFCLEQAKCLSKKLKVEFHSFSSIYPEFLYPGGTKEYSKIFTIQENKNLKIKRILSWYNPFSWIYVGLTNQGDIVHINWWIYILFPVFFTIVTLSKLRKKKVILTLHNVIAHESNFLDRLFSSIMYKISDILLVHTENNKETLIKQFKINRNKIHVIPYGPLNFFKTKNISQSTAKKHLGLKDKNKVILFFGMIRKYKGIDILIKAFSEIIKQIPKAKLLIAGECWTNWSEYDDLIKNLQLKQNVITKIRFIPTSEVKYFFTVADLLVLPYSYFESQTAVGILGLTFNKAMVVTRVGGLPELVKNKECVVEPNNPKELAKAIVKVLKNEKFQEELKKDSGNLARKYSWDKIAKKTINLYINILNN